MLSYYLKLGSLSMRRNPVLTTLMVVGIGIGVGACMTVVTIFYVMSGDPIPQKSDRLYYVQLDSWDPHNGYGDEGLPPDQLTYRDATALLEARRATRQVVSYEVSRILQPGGDDARPFELEGRATSADFFAMFEVPFVYGGGWDRAADESREQVVVLRRDVSERLFGDDNPVGRRVVMNGDEYRVSGVTEMWSPVPKFYDLTTGAFNDADGIYIPFSVAIDKELNGSGNTNCWQPVPDGGWQAFLNSECIWMQMWVELDSPEARREYLDFLDAYVESQKALGRFPRPLDNRLSDVMQHLAERGVIDDSVRILLVLAGLFLLVCVLNTVGLLLAKVMRRSSEISLRRAVGASRRAVFAQYAVEASLVGLTGGLVGIGLTWLGLRGIERLFDGAEQIRNLIRLDWTLLLIAIALAVISALLAAVYPTWRATLVQPATQLKAN